MYRSTINAVQVQIIIVSVKTPSDCIKPCFTGCEVSAVAAALGALPIPASLENKPLFIPTNIVPVNVPTVKSLKLSACENIASNTCGIKFMFLKTINNATNMYATANIGTITSVIFAIL